MWSMSSEFFEMNQECSDRICNHRAGGVEKRVLSNRYAVHGECLLEIRRIGPLYFKKIHALAREQPIASANKCFDSVQLIDLTRFDIASGIMRDYAYELTCAHVQKG